MPSLKCKFAQVADSIPGWSEYDLTGDDAASQPPAASHSPAGGRKAAPGGAQPAGMPAPEGV